jgi:hypothetical protein
MPRLQSLSSYIGIGLEPGTCQAHTTGLQSQRPDAAVHRVQEYKPLRKSRSFFKIVSSAYRQPNHHVESH